MRSEGPEDLHSVCRARNKRIPHVCKRFQKRVEKEQEMFVRFQSFEKKWVTLGLCVCILLGSASPALAENLAVDEVDSDSFTDETFAEEEEDIDLSDEENQSAEEIIAEEAANLAVSEGKYLKELRVASASTAKEAKKILTDAGYQVIDQNVNENADDLISKEKAVYIGYTTTSDVTEAVRDIALMNLEGDYRVMDLDTAVSEQLADYQYIEEEHYVMLQEFRENYAAKAPLALAAYDGLNQFVEDDSGMLLGDYLLQIDLTPSTETGLSDFFRMFSTVSADALTVIDTWLAYGLATYGQKNFLQRVSEMSDLEIDAAKKDKVNISNAEIMLPYIREYVQGMIQLSDAIDNSDLEEQLDENAESLDDETRYYITQDVYFEYLDGYDYDDGTLTDFLLSGTLTEEDVTLLASQMSEAQQYAVKYVGFGQILRQEAADSANWKEEDVQVRLQDMMQEQMSDVIAQVLREAENYGANTEEGQPLSIYYGINRDKLKGTIAVTTDAYNKMSATMDYSYFASDYEENSFVKPGLAVTGLFGVMLTLAGIAEMFDNTHQVVMIKKVTVVNDVIDDLAYESWFDLTTEDASTFAEKFVAEDQLYGDRVSSVLVKSQWGTVLLAGGIALILLAVSGYFLYNTYKKEHKVFDRTVIPDVIIDLRTTKSGIPYYVRYDSVKEFTSTNRELDPGDVNGYVGDQWNVLYTTTNVDAGEPVQADFRVETKTAKPLKNETGIHMIGESAEKNLNSYTYNEKNADAIYIYAKTGVVTGLIGSMFSGTGGFAAALILGILIGMFLMTLLHVFRSRWKKNAQA